MTPGLTGEEYVGAEAWRDARLGRCPNHPHGGCSLAGHGAYARKTPRGAKIARWYCRERHMTISLLPDCLAARLPGSLDALEAVVVVAEGAKSQTASLAEKPSMHQHSAWTSRRGRVRPTVPKGSCNFFTSLTRNSEVRDYGIIHHALYQQLLTRQSFHRFGWTSARRSAQRSRQESSPHLEPR